MAFDFDFNPSGADRVNFYVGDGTGSGRKTIAYKLTANGLEPQPGFGGFTAQSGQTISPTLFHSGGMAPRLSSEGTNLDIVITETYLAPIFIPCNMTLTGLAVFNGTAVAGNLTVYLADSTGKVLANSASTAQSGTTAYQRVAFSAPLAVKGPATYFAAVQGSSASGDLRCHVFGNFPAGKLTSTTYGTLATFTPPTTFTTGLGPMVSCY